MLNSSAECASCMSVHVLSVLIPDIELLVISKVHLFDMSTSGQWPLSNRSAGRTPVELAWKANHRARVGTLLLFGPHGPPLAHWVGLRMPSENGLPQVNSHSPS